MLSIWRVYVCFQLLFKTFRTVSGGLCAGGSNIYTEIMENSPSGTFITNLTIFGDPVTNSIKLCLSGPGSEWFYLEGKTIRLNVSSGKALDREALESPVLMPTLTCSEYESIQVQYGVVVQVLNENDNRPAFIDNSSVPQNISELAAVNTVLFTVKADDLDGDVLMYVIDTTSIDASYFRIDLPNSGKIILAKPLDYERKQNLEIIVYAVEMNTQEHYNSSTRVHIHVMDGDDQYPHFLPCNILSHENTNVCISPIYTANVTEGELKTRPLGFSPGHVCAEDPDFGLKASVRYSIISGGDNGRFGIDQKTGAITMKRPVENRHRTPSFILNIMASQMDDPNKYSLTTAHITVLAPNQHSPEFDPVEVKGFVYEGSGAAALVLTFGSEVLSIQALDDDFANGFNPQIQYFVLEQLNHTKLFQVTWDGVIIAKANLLKAYEQYFLQVAARDEESGEMTTVYVDIKVLHNSEEVPVDPYDTGRLFTMTDFILLAGVLGVLLILITVVSIIRCTLNKRWQQQESTDRAAVAVEKHPNVSLRWFHLVNPRKLSTCIEVRTYQNEAYSSSGEESIGDNTSITACTKREMRSNCTMTHKFQQDIKPNPTNSSKASKPDIVSEHSIKMLEETTETIQTTEAHMKARPVLTNGKMKERAECKTIQHKHQSDQSPVKLKTPEVMEKAYGSMGSQRQQQQHDEKNESQLQRTSESDEEIEVIVEDPLESAKLYGSDDLNQKGTAKEHELTFNKNSVCDSHDLLISVETQENAEHLKLHTDHTMTEMQARSENKTQPIQHPSEDKFLQHLCGVDVSPFGMMLIKEETMEF